MAYYDSAKNPHDIVSRLIELVAQLPEADQHSLLRELETRDMNAAAPKVDGTLMTASEYCSSDYVYWDLFKTN
ncbi:MAG: hypothetical protein HKM93_05715 [Desulfobacteraceae bacterium]|nr:hypothetical protein [Desulfobacteraceae bacterium]